MVTVYKEFDKLQSPQDVVIVIEQYLDAVCSGLPALIKATNIDVEMPKEMTGRGVVRTMTKLLTAALTAAEKAARERDSVPMGITREEADIIRSAAFNMISWLEREGLDADYVREEQMKLAALAVKCNKFVRGE